MLLIGSDTDTGVIYVDTMQLDGETNLKEKNAPLETAFINENLI